MDRRWGGMLTLLVAVVAALVVGHLQVKQLAGTAVHGAIPGPPRIGDCLLGADDGGMYTDLHRRHYPELSIGPCAGRPRYGEVAGVVAGGLTWKPPSGDYMFNDPADPAVICAAMAGRYLGQPDRFTEPSQDPGDPVWWFDSLAIGPTLGQPSELQRGFGQNWVACVVVNYNTGLTSTEYSGSLQQVFVDHQVPAALATCLDSVPASVDVQTVVDCATDHPAESFGSNFAAHDNPSDRLARMNSCTTLVRDLTGMDDPTAGGRLQVTVVSSQSAALSNSTDTANTDEVINGVAYRCLVTATAGHRLTGPLLGHGDQPAPVS